MMSALAPTDRYFQSDGLRLHYVEWGRAGGETLVLVHGNRDQCRSWDFFVAGLCARPFAPQHVVFLDLRGHGDSDWSPPGRGYQHQDFIRDLSALLRHLGKDSATFVGHSLGGSLCVLFAGSFPARVHKLILVESVGPYARADEDVPRILAEWLEGDGAGPEGSCYATLQDAAKAIQKKFPRISDEVSVHMARHGTKPADQGYIWKYDPRARQPSYSAFSEGQIRAFIQRISCPTLLVYGSEGNFTKSPRAPRMKLFNGGRIIAVSGSGHHVPHERPGELAEVVAAFLRE